MPGHFLYLSDEEESEDNNDGNDEEEEKPEPKREKIIIKIRGTRASRKHSRVRRSLREATASTSVAGFGFIPKTWAEPDTDKLTALSFRITFHCNNYAEKEHDRQILKRRDSKKFPLRDLFTARKGEKMDKLKLQIGGPDRASLGEVRPGLRSASERPNLARARTAEVAVAAPAIAANRRGSVWLPHVGTFMAVV